MATTKRGPDDGGDRDGGARPQPMALHRYGAAPASTHSDSHQQISAWPSRPEGAIRRQSHAFTVSRGHGMVRPPSDAKRADDGCWGWNERTPRSDASTSPSPDFDPGGSEVRSEHAETSDELQNRDTKGPSGN